MKITKKIFSRTKNKEIDPKLQEMTELMKKTDKFEHFPFPHDLASKVYSILYPEETQEG